MEMTSGAGEPSGSLLNDWASSGLNLNGLKKARVAIAAKDQIFFNG